MSDYQTIHLNDTTIHGYLRERGAAWTLARVNIEDAKNREIVFDGAVPDYAVERLLNWVPLEKDCYVEDGTQTVFDAQGNAYEIPKFKKIIKEYGKGAGKGRKAIYHPGEDAFIEVHGSTYNHLSGYSKLLDFAMLLVDGEADVYSAGIPGWGDIGWIQIVLRETIKIGGLTIRPNIIIGSSLNGSMAERTKYTTILTVCDNTFAMAMAEQIGRDYRVRHTPNAERNVSKARERLDIAFAVSEEFAKEFNQLANTTVSDSVWDAIVADIVKVPEEEGRGRTMALNAVGRLNTLWHHDERIAPFAGSLAGVVQTFNTYGHWDAPVHKNTDRLERQALKALNGNDGTPLSDILTSYDRHKVLVG